MQSPFVAIHAAHQWREYSQRKSRENAQVKSPYKQDAAASCSSQHQTYANTIGRQMKLDGEVVEQKKTKQAQHRLQSSAIIGQHQWAEERLIEQESRTAEPHPDGGRDLADGSAHQKAHGALHRLKAAAATVRKQQAEVRYFSNLKRGEDTFVHEIVDRQSPQLKDLEPQNRTRFSKLLESLQKEHDKEIRCTRSELEDQLKALNKELLAVRSGRQHGLEMNASLQTPDIQANDIMQQILLQDRSTTRREIAKSETKQSDQNVNGMPGTKSFAAPRISLSFTEDTNQDEASKRQQMEHELALIRGWAKNDEISQTSRFVHRFIVPDEIKPRWQQNLISLVECHWFEFCCAVGILLNAVLLGAQVDYASRFEISLDETPQVFNVLERIFSVWFLLELLSRIIAYDLSFFVRHGWGWNIFDLIIVGTDILQTALELIVGKPKGNFTSLRMLRMLRATRALRTLRLVRFFKELRMMAYSIMQCGTSLMWSALMFFIIIYMFGIFLISSVTYYVADNPESPYYATYRKQWHSLPRGMWTLFLCMTGGVSWTEVSGPLINIGWIFGAIVGLFMFFTIYIATNIITGVFVEQAIQSAKNQQEELIQEQLHGLESERQELKEVFEAADTDKSGTLTRKEFEAHVQDEQVRAHLDSMGLATNEALGLFTLLDYDQSGTLEIEEFLCGCSRLKGGASSLDLANLMYEHKRLVKELKKFQTDIFSSLQVLHERLDRSVMFDD